MNDFNVKIDAIDGAMDSFDDILLKMSDLSKVVERDVRQLGADICARIDSLERQKVDLLQTLAEAEAKAEENGEEEEGQDLSELYNSIAAVDENIQKLEALSRKQTITENTYLEGKARILGAIRELIENGNRDMATYLVKISAIPSVNAIGSNGPARIDPSISCGGSDGYRIVIIDSRKHPQSAEHIQACIRMGYPAILTLNRAGADENRKRSLAGYRSRRRDGYDRDEYPPAAFLEGGEGAHVFYLASADNQGSGSSFGRQLLNAPDGTRVRFRVI